MARAGGPINFMASEITQDRRVTTAVQDYFEAKYRGLEKYLNGGKIVNMEDGMRPFYRMLQRKETLVVLGDSPPLQPDPSEADVVVNFLGARRRLAGGALRLAQATDSDIGAYVCNYESPGRYSVKVSQIGSPHEIQTIQQIYDFFSTEILRNPGLWWGADLLPSMPEEQIASDLHAIT